MTARRPTRRAIDAALAPTPRPAAPEPDTDQAPAVAPAARSRVLAGTVDDTGKVKPTKYTLLLDATTVEAFDRLALDARRALGGRRVTKSDLVRALVLLAADDAALKAQLVDMIAGSTTA